MFFDCYEFSFKPRIDMSSGLNSAITIKQEEVS